MPTITYTGVKRPRRPPRNRIPDGISFFLRFFLTRTLLFWEEPPLIAPSALNRFSPDRNTSPESISPSPSNFPNFGQSPGVSLSDYLSVSARPGFFSGPNPSFRRKMRRVALFDFSLILRFRKRFCLGRPIWAIRFLRVCPRWVFGRVPPSSLSGRPDAFVLLSRLNLRCIGI